MFPFLNASPKLIVTEKTYAYAFHISNSSKIIGYERKSRKTTSFGAAADLHHKKAGYFTQFEIFSHVGGSRRSRFNLKSDVVNLK